MDKKLQSADFLHYAAQDFQREINKVMI